MNDPDLKPFFAVLGAHLRERRRIRHLTQEDMIGHGFSARHWQQVEAGRPITLQTLVRACLALDARPSVLLRHAERQLPRVGGAASRSSTGRATRG